MHNRVLTQPYGRLTLTSRMTESAKGFRVELLPSCQTGSAITAGNVQYNTRIHAQQGTHTAICASDSDFTHERVCMGF